MRNSVTPVVDILIVIVVSGLAFFLEGYANAQGWVSVGEDARGVSGVLAGALCAVGLNWLRGGTLADLGFKRPERWARVPLQVIAILIVFGAAQNLVPMLLAAVMSVPMPEPDLSRHAAVSGNLGAAMTMMLVLPLTASIPEEIIYRGFLIGRLTEVFGEGTGGAVLAVLIQALIFGSVHFQWGVGGMLMTTIMGLIWGTAYLLCGRNLWVVILAHSGGHIVLVTLLYLS